MEDHKEHKPSGRKSLEEVHGTVDYSRHPKAWRKILAFFGPAYLVSVGYMDPGNWATDIAGGSKYGYALIWVLVMSNLMALLLQSFSARMGLAAGRDLAQASRESYPRGVNFMLYLLAEIAIAACDLAEVLGMAIGLKLLFHIPIIWGVAITVLDTILLLFLQRLGMRKMEVFIVSLVAIIGLSFFVELLFAQPSGAAIVGGLKPTVPDSTALYILIGILGATVMPHNLYLHSALVQTRKVQRDTASIKQALKWSVADSAIALNVALLVNASILILAASAFYTRGHNEVASIEEAHRLLQPLLGQELAPILFAVALIAAGQSSTVTGTLAGQIIMEGYLNLRIAVWLRRMITRLLAVVPAFFTVLFAGEESANDLLILSQVILSLQLGFAIIPLIHFVSDKQRMNGFAVGPWAKTAAWVIAALIISFNFILVKQTISEWVAANPDKPWLQVLLIILAVGFAVLLGYTILYPILRRRKEERKAQTVHGKIAPLGEMPAHFYKRIAVTVDFTDSDRKALSHALQLGGSEAEYHLIHVLETAGARMLGREAADFEAQSDRRHLEKYVAELGGQGYKVSCTLGYGRRAETIAAEVKKFDADILVMGAHGHQLLGDLLHGETINRVRHLVSVPLLAVK